MNTKTSCHLCSEIAGERANDLISELLAERDYVRRVPFETPNFAAIPSLGPIAPGHTLLCPKEHVCNLASLPLELAGEFADAKAKLAEVVEGAFSEPVHCFEHGSSANGGRVLCTVDHAHLHLLPASTDIIPRLRQGLRWVAAPLESDQFRVMVFGREYLYYEPPHGAGMVALAGADGFESQFLRRVFAEALGRPDDWNWRSNPRPDEADRLHFLLMRAGGELLRPDSRRATTLDS